jgi:hypothetical protein
MSRIEGLGSKFGFPLIDFAYFRHALALNCTARLVEESEPERDLASFLPA